MLCLKFTCFIPWMSFFGVLAINSDAQQMKTMGLTSAGTNYDNLFCWAWKRGPRSSAKIGLNWRKKLAEVSCCSVILSLIPFMRFMFSNRKRIVPDSAPHLLFAEKFTLGPEPSDHPTDEEEDAQEEDDAGHHDAADLLAARQNRRHVWNGQLPESDWYRTFSVGMKKTISSAEAPIRCHTGLVLSLYFRRTFFRS